MSDIVLCNILQGEIDEEIKMLSDNLHKFDIKYAIISPNLRTMRTCMESMKSHPNYSKVEYIIDPVIKASSDKPYDLTRYKLTELKEMFGEGLNLTVHYENTGNSLMDLD